MYGALRSALFLADAERAHRLALRLLRPVHRSPRLQRAVAPPALPPRLAVRFLGHDLSGPLGVAAGFDKGAECYNALLALGFGHVEVGTVTPRPQPGNPRPRIERWPHQRALVNRLGFPGPGAAAVAKHMDAVPPRGLVGANVGPNKDTPPEGVVADVAAAAHPLAPHAAFLTVNVSSPNTPGLRGLQTPTTVARLVAAAASAADDAGTPRPILLKLHPDAPDVDLVATARAAVDAGAQGIVAVNTTLHRPAEMGAAMAGGLSGAPLRKRAREVVAALHNGLGRDTVVVGVGGVATGDDAFALVAAGATVVQAYTGFVYRGPRMPARVHGEVMQALDRHGLDRLEEAVGTGTGTPQ